MSDEEFLTSINPLFTVYELEKQVNDVSELLDRDDDVTEEELNELTDYVTVIQSSLSRLSDYLEELSTAHGNVQTKFDGLVDVIAKRVNPKGKTNNEDSSEQRQHDVGDINGSRPVSQPTNELSDEEREKLQEHIPAITSDDDADARRSRRASEQTARLVRLRPAIVRLVRQTYKVSGDVKQTRDGVKVIKESVKEGKQRPNKVVVVVDKPNKTEKKRKVLEADTKTKEPSKTQKKPTNTNGTSNIKTSSKKPKSAESKAKTTPSKADEKPPEKSPEEIAQEQERILVAQAAEEERIQRETKEREQREETERRRKEAEERKKKEDEERMAEEKRSNHENWDCFRYTLDPGHVSFPGDLGCIVKVEADTMSQDQMTCEALHERADTGPQEHRVSNVISLRTTNNSPIHYKHPAMVLLPYMADPTRTPVVYIQEGKGQWTVTESEQVEEDGVSLAVFRRRHLKSLRCVVALSLASGSLKCTPGVDGYLQSPHDPTIGVRVPKDAFSSETNIELRVIPHTNVAAALDRLQNKDVLEDASAVTVVDVRGDVIKPLVLEANLSNNGRVSVNRTFVHVMKSCDSGVTWSHCDPGYRAEPERFTVQLTHESQRVVFLRTRGYVLHADVQDVTVALMRHLTEYPACVALVHNQADPQHVGVQVCRRQVLDETATRLADKGYVWDPNLMRPINLRDGTRLLITFNPEGNIDFDDIKPAPEILTFFSKLDMVQENTDYTIKVKNLFCQRHYARYRGKLVVHDVTEGTDFKKRVFVCEIPVTLPKAETNTDGQGHGEEGQDSKPTEVKKVNQYFRGVEPLTEDYVHELADNISDDWLDLAYELALPSNTVQQIKQRSTEHDDRAFDLLRTWYMKSKTDSNKISRLVEALRAVGLSGLGDDLERKNADILDAKRRKNKEQLFSKMAKRISADPRALDNWKGILLGLRLTDNDVAQVEGERENRIARLQAGLARWLQASEEKATPTALITVLKKMGYHAAAEQASFCVV